MKPETSRQQISILEEKWKLNCNLRLKNFLISHAVEHDSRSTLHERFTPHSSVKLFFCRLFPCRSSEKFLGNLLMIKKIFNAMTHWTYLWASKPKPDVPFNHSEICSANFPPLRDDEFHNFLLSQRKHFESRDLRRHLCRDFFSSSYTGNDWRLVLLCLADF